MLRLSNTLSGRLETFQPLEPHQAKMYTCGPTVYDFVHIGNLRTFVFQDVLKRYLRYKGFQVFHVMNITDVDDKTIRDSGARTIGQLRQFTDRFTRAFFEDCDRLGIEKPDRAVHATDHIDDMVALIRQLQSRGHTYQKDGSIYFRIDSFRDYGKLTKLDKEGIRAGARVDVDEYDKQDARDFVLWKAPKNGEPRWETPLGPGRPGWHIECSAMSMKYLGDTFDLHCGAVDLIFPHHENEIAQSEAATAKPFVRYWVHGEHLIVDGEKMSKSKGNFFTLRDLLEKGIQPGVVRYALQSVPYKRQLNFTAAAIRQAEASLQRLQDFKQRIETEPLRTGPSSELHSGCQAVLERFGEAMDRDLNTAQALAAIFDWVREVNTALAAGRMHDGDRSAILATMEKLNRVLPLWESEKSRLDPQIQSLIEQRSRARQARNFALADEFRDRIHDLGYLIEDTREGVRWKKR